MARHRAAAEAEICRPRPVRRPKAAAADLDLSRPVELIALAVKQSAVRCRILGSQGEITLRSRSRDARDIVPGEILTVRARKQWRFAGHPYLAGQVAGRRLDVSALGLTPLRLSPHGMWDPAKQYWGEEGAPVAECLHPIIEHGPRPQFEMEQVLPRDDSTDPFADPILEATDLAAAGDPAGARAILMELLAADLRCLDAHAHLGNFAFPFHPEEALAHYEVGVLIAELTLGADFNGVLPWGRIDNRPFLWCLHGYGLCLWRRGRSDQAARVFERILWLNPPDNQGIRFLIGPVRDGQSWEDFDRGEQGGRR